MAQNLRPVPNYIEGEVIQNSDWHARGGVDRRIRGATRTAAVIHNVPRLATQAMDGLVMVNDKADRVTRIYPHLTDACIEIEQTVLDVSVNAIRRYGNGNGNRCYCC